MGLRTVPRGGAVPSLAVGDFARWEGGDRLAAMSRLANLPALALLLAACGQAEDREPAPISADEAQALEDAASMLDEQRLETEVAPENSDPAPAEEE